MTGWEKDCALLYRHQGLDALPQQTSFSFRPRRELNAHLRQVCRLHAAEERQVYPRIATVPAKDVDLIYRGSADEQATRSTAIFGKCALCLKVNTSIVLAHRHQAIGADRVNWHGR